MPANLSEKENTKSYTSSGRMKETMQANLEENVSNVLH